MGARLSSAVVTQIQGLVPPPHMPHRRGGVGGVVSHVVRESRGNEPASCRGNTGAGMTGMKTRCGRADCGLDAAPALPEFQSRRGAGPLDGPSPRSPWSPYSLSGLTLIFVP